MISAEESLNSDLHNPAVAIRSVSFAYPRCAPLISNCDLDLVPGRVLGILGPNGSGKTTLLKLIAGGLNPSKGTVSVRGRIGYVPQFIRVNFAYSVMDMVLMGRTRQIGLFAIPSRQDEHAASAALERIGIASLASRPFDELSGGERQLVALARALAAEANVLVLDEPMSALDLRHQQVVLQWMRRLAHNDGLTIAFSTHQPQHVDVIADDVALMFGPGEIMKGSVREVLQPEPLARLFGVSLRRVWCADGDPERGLLIPEWNFQEPPSSNQM